MRGKDVGLRKAGTIRLRKRVVVDDETKEFLLGFVDKLEDEFKTVSKESVQPLPDQSGLDTSPFELATNGVLFLRLCISKNQPLTRAGLKIFLGVSKDVSLEGEKGLVMEKLLQFIEMYSESALHTRQNPIGAIFALKNMGWADSVDLNVRPAPTMTVEERMAAKKRISQFSE